MSDFAVYVLVVVASGLVGVWIGESISAGRARDRSRRLAREVAQLSRRLRERETEGARMAALLSGMVEGVLVVDADGHLQLVNDAARRMLNLDSNLSGRHYVEAMRHPGVVGQLSAALQGERLPPIEVPLEPSFAAGGGRIFRAQTTPASPEGGGAVLVLHDISDLRRIDRMRRDFVANVSHELRTPLTAVRGYVEALMEEPVDSAQRRTFLDVIDRHTKRMERLVRDLLRLARLDALQEPAEPQPVDVGAMFRSLAAEVSDRLDRQQIGVDVSVDGDAATIDADPVKLHDALFNLLENAANYSPPGARIELGARLEGDRALLTVADRGPGIPDADLERIFERFYRVDKSRTSDPGGTGLGLSIVRHLIELHGGRVRAQNRKGGGAVFTVSLPHRRQRG